MTNAQHKLQHIVGAIMVAAIIWALLAAGGVL